MKIEEAIIDAQRRQCPRMYAIMSDGHGKTTDQIAAAINRNGSTFAKMASQLQVHRSMQSFAVIPQSSLRKQDESV